MNGHGYHYYSEYLQCPRRWYIDNILGIKPIEKPFPLKFGSLWHKAVEQVLKGTPLEVILESLSQDVSRIPQEKELYYRQFPIQLKAWSAGWQAGRAALPEPELLFTEQPVETVLWNNQKFVGIIDGAVKTAEGLVYLLEHKTTSYRVSKTLESLDLEDQLTAYLLLAKRAWPDMPLAGVIVDVTGFYEGAPVPVFSVLTRTDEEMFDFEQGFSNLIGQVEDKVAQLPSRNPFELFPRNGAWCSMFGCSYKNVCREHLELNEFSPEWFCSSGLLVEDGHED